MRLVSRGLRGGRGGRRRGSTPRDRADPRRGRAARRPHRADDRDTHARRSRLRPRPPRARSRHPGDHPRGGRGRVPARSDGGRRRDRGRERRPPVHPYAGPPAGALLPRRGRHDAGGRAVARAHRRLALRGRHGPPRPRGRRDGGRGGPLPLAAAAPRAAGRGRGVPRARRGIALRHLDELQGIDDDRLRTALQPDARSVRGRRVHRGVRRRLGAEAAQPRAHRRAEPGGLPAHARRRARARRAARRLAAPRRPPRSGPPRGTPTRRRQHPGLRHELLDEGRLRPRRRRARDGARRPTPTRRSGRSGASARLRSRTSRATCSAAATK